MTDHDSLRQLAQNATPGPWESELEENPGTWDALVYTMLGGERVVAQEMSDEDAEFIAAANPTTVLSLLDEIRDLRHRNLHLSLERDAYRRGQGPAPTPATPGTVALHETHPIPNSRGDDQ